MGIMRWNIFLEGAKGNLQSQKGASLRELTMVGILRWDAVRGVNPKP